VDSAAAAEFSEFARRRWPGLVRLACAVTGERGLARPAAIGGRLVLRGLAGAGVALEGDRERSVRVECGVRHDRYAADGTA
jgi:hypothetical protein